jgi:hypothetical protein
MASGLVSEPLRLPLYFPEDAQTNGIYAAVLTL